MKVSKIVENGELSYIHHYLQTMTSEETREHRLAVPKTLKTIAKNHPDADVVIYNDNTLGIEINGKLWAAESPHEEFRAAKTLPHEIWQYCNLAMGRDGDTYARAQ